MRRFLAVAAALALTGIVAAACGGGGSKTFKNPITGDTFSASDKLPSDFPSDFPVYKGANVQASYKGSEGGISGQVVIWQTGDSVDKVKSFYDGELDKGPWKTSSSGNAAGNSFWIADNSNGNKTAWVSVADSDGKTVIVAAVGDKQDASSGDSGQAEDTPTPRSGNGSSGKDTPTTEPEAAATTTSPLPDEVSLSGDFPRDRVPFPSGARVTSDSSYSSGGQKIFVTEIYVKQSASSVSDYYKGELPRHDWTETLTTSENGEFMLMYSGATDESVIITIAESETPGYAKVSLMVTMASS